MVGEGETGTGHTRALLGNSHEVLGGQRGLTHSPPSTIAVWVHLRSSKIKKSSCYKRIRKFHMQIEKFSHVSYGQYAK